MISFRLPFPPSVNSYWRHIAKGPLAGRVLISAKGREYRTDCEHAVLMQRVQRGALKGRLAVSLVANVPDKRVRDLDNMLKSSLDAIKHCGVINDDGDIDKITIERGPYVKGGQLLVEISEAGR